MKNFFWLLALLFVIVLPAWWTISISYHNPHDEIITVNEKSIHANGDKESTYLIFTKDEVYEIDDMFWAFFFHSSDVYRVMEVGGTYKVHVMGRRIPFFSAYKNIVSAEKVEVDNGEQVL